MDAQYPDVMIDIETTGTHPEHNAVIQIAAVRFNLNEKTVDANSMFDRCLAVAPHRFWEESTRTWWHGKNFKVFRHICSRMEDPGTVMKAFLDWSVSHKTDEPQRFWGKPTHFDYSFMQSYFRQFGLPIPYHYRHARDMNTFIAGLAGNPQHRELNVDFVGDAHNALHDALHQIKILFAAKDIYDETHHRD